MYNIFGIDFDKKPDYTVKVWIDENLRDVSKKTKHSENRDSDDKMIQGEKKGSFQATGRDERVYKLRIAYEQGSITTLQEALKYIEVSERTIISYLREIGIKLYDTEKDKYVGMLNPNQRIVRNTVGVSKPVIFEYYTKDPSKGGQLIDKGTYDKLKDGE